MRYLRLFENMSAQSIREMAKKYEAFLDDIKPYVVRKYNELANDENYEQDFGDKPFLLNPHEELFLSKIGFDNKMFQFVLYLFDDEHTICNQFYIDITDNELNDILMELNANKYNL